MNAVPCPSKKEIKRKYDNSPDSTKLPEVGLNPKGCSELPFGYFALLGVASGLTGVEFFS